MAFTTFTNAADFLVRPLQVQGLENADVLANFNNILSETEKTYLISLTGYEFYKNLIAGVSAETVLEKWQNLINGVEFTDSSSKLNYFWGIPDMLKCFVFYEYQKELNTGAATGSGNMEFQGAESSKRSVDYSKYRNIYNIGVQKSKIFRDLLKVSSDIYGSITETGLNEMLW